MSPTFCHCNWLNSAAVTLRLFAPTCKVAEKLSGKVANRTTQAEWEWERPNEAETVRHPLLQQHLRQLQLLYLYLVADWRLYLKDFVQTCRKYSSHIRKLFNKLNAAKKSGKMAKERRKPKAKSCSKPKGNFTSWAGGLAGDSPRPELAKTFRTGP